MCTSKSVKSLLFWAIGLMLSATPFAYAFKQKMTIISNGNDQVKMKACIAKQGISLDWKCTTPGKDDTKGMRSDRHKLSIMRSLNHGYHFKVYMRKPGSKMHGSIQCTKPSHHIKFKLKNCSGILHHGGSAQAQFACDYGTRAKIIKVKNLEVQYTFSATYDKKNHKVTLTCSSS